MFKLEYISVLIIVGAIGYYMYTLKHDQEVIEQQKIKIHNQQVEIQKIKDDYKRKQFELNQSSKYSNLKQEIHNIDQSNNQLTYDKNKSVININTVKDSKKLEKLESNNTYILEIN